MMTKSAVGLMVLALSGMAFASRPALGQDSASHGVPAPPPPRPHGSSAPAPRTGAAPAPDIGPVGAPLALGPSTAANRSGSDVQPEAVPVGSPTSAVRTNHFRPPSPEDLEGAAEVVSEPPAPVPSPPVAS